MTLNVAYGAQIEAAARRYGLDPRLLAAVAAQETGGPGADSGRNVVGDGGHGHGLFQIDDRYHAFAASASAMDPAANADYAAGMLASLAKRYGGDVRAALSAYNAGSPNATGTRTDWGDATLGYADSVLRHYGRLRAVPGAGAGSQGKSQAPAAAAPPNGAEASVPPAAGLLGAGAGLSAGPGLTALTSEQTVAPADSSLYAAALDSPNGAPDAASTSNAKLIAGTSDMSASDGA